MKKLHLVLLVLTNYFGLPQNANKALVAFHKNTRSTLLIDKKNTISKGEKHFLPFTQLFKKNC
jgi:hypothetical protein